MDSLVDETHRFWNCASGNLTIDPTHRLASTASFLDSFRYTRKCSNDSTTTHPNLLVSISMAYVVIQDKISALHKGLELPSSEMNQICALEGVFAGRHVMLTFCCEGLGNLRHQKLSCD